MGADGLCGARCVERLIGDIESGLAGMAQQPGFGATGVHVSLHADDGGDMRMPIGSGQLAGGFEDRDGAGFVTVAAGVMAMGTAVRGVGGGNALDQPAQGRLIIFDLDDEGDVGLCGDLEMFF